MLFIPGKFPIAELEKLIREAAGIREEGERIAFLSGRFAGIPYRESTLVGDKSSPEALVINLEGMDCFTLVDYVEALRLSGSFSGFAENLRRVRYRDGKVSFETRNHFLTDWAEYNREFIEDATGKIGGKDAQNAEKVLNKKEDGSAFVSGIPLVERKISYIPSHTLDDSMMGRLATGDYAGIYSPAAGLDVSHVGIIIKESGALYLRHASKRYGSVMDEDFAAYIAETAGLIVLRPKRRAPES